MFEGSFLRRSPLWIHLYMSLQDLVALESEPVQATEGAVASESADKAMGNLPKVIEIGSDLSQITAQIGQDDDPEVPQEPKVRISNSSVRRLVYGTVVLGILLLTVVAGLVSLSKIWKLLIFPFV